MKSTAKGRVPLTLSLSFAKNIVRGTLVRIPLSPDGIPMLNMAKPIVKPDLLLVDANQRNGRRMSSGIKGFIMGDTSKISSNFPGRETEERDYEDRDHLADVVDIIVARRDDQEEVDKARLLASSVTDLSEDQGTYSIANISDKFIRFDGIVTKMKKQLEEEKRIKFQEERKNRKLIR